MLLFVGRKALTPVNRCEWIKNKDSLYTQYHDNEWCVPKYDDTILFELLLLEMFHTGLSWYLILCKREHFRQAFDGFNHHLISEYTQEKIDELLNNPKIIRNKLKILAAINNSKAFIKIQQEFGSFSNYIWHFSNKKIIKNTDNQFRNRSELSDLISQDFKKRGFKFLGTITTYSYLQAIGVINDHETSCDFY